LEIYKPGDNTVVSIESDENQDTRIDFIENDIQKWSMGYSVSNDRFFIYGFDKSTTPL